MYELVKEETGYIVHYPVPPEMVGVRLPKLSMDERGSGFLEYHLEFSTTGCNSTGSRWSTVNKPISKYNVVEKIPLFADVDIATLESLCCTSKLQMGPVSSGGFGINIPRLITCMSSEGAFEAVGKVFQTQLSLS